jgi:hypothetical protein
MNQPPLNAPAPQIRKRFRKSSYDERNDDRLRIELANDAAAGA